MGPFDEVCLSDPIDNPIVQLGYLLRAPVREHSLA